MAANGQKVPRKATIGHGFAVPQLYGIRVLWGGRFGRAPRVRRAENVPQLVLLPASRASGALTSTPVRRDQVNLL
jgi:hypothetical protein